MSTSEQSFSAFQEHMRTIEAGVAEMAREDPDSLSDAALLERMGQLVPLLELLETCATKFANIVIARTFAVSEVAQTG